MELITSAVLTYLGFLTSWWWILFAVISVVAIICLHLKEDDPVLSIRKAVQLSLAGILGLVPLVRNLIPVILQLDFRTRWIILGGGRVRFIYIVLILSILSFLLGPILFSFIIGLVTFDHYKSLPFSRDVSRYGFREAIHLSKYKRN